MFTKSVQNGNFFTQKSTLPPTYSDENAKCFVILFRLSFEYARFKFGSNWRKALGTSLSCLWKWQKLTLKWPLQTKMAVRALIPELFFCGFTYDRHTYFPPKNLNGVTET